MIGKILMLNKNLNLIIKKKCKLKAINKNNSKNPDNKFSNSNSIDNSINSINPIDNKVFYFFYLFFLSNIFFFYVNYIFCIFFNIDRSWFNRTKFGEGNFIKTDWENIYEINKTQLDKLTITGKVEPTLLFQVH